MKKLTGTILALAVCALAAGPALAHDGHDHGKPVELTGWVVDKDCGARNANADGKDCIVACNKKGSPLVLAAGEKIYGLSDQKGAKAHIGHEVVVKGTVDEKGNLTVASIEKAGKKG